jgi:hypothetical protein
MPTDDPDRREDPNGAAAFETGADPHAATKVAAVSDVTTISHVAAIAAMITEAAATTAELGGCTAGSQSREAERSGRRDREKS